MTPQRVVAQQRAAFADKEAYSSAPALALKASLASLKERPALIFSKCLQPVVPPVQRDVRTPIVERARSRNYGYVRHFADLSLLGPCLRGIRSLSNFPQTCEHPNLG